MERKMAHHSQWQLSAAAAERYERYVARFLLGPWAPSLLDAAQLGPAERVLDVACGTGVVARAAAQRVGCAGRVVGADLNCGMIAVARSLAAPAGASIEWVECSALALQLPDATMDVVVCQQGLQFFPDKALALREMRRVLVTGGRLALSVWAGVGIYNSAVGEALTRFVGNAAAEQFYATRRVPSAEALLRLATQAGFSAVDVQVSRMNVHLPRLDKFALDQLSATPLASLIAATAPTVREQIGASVMKALEPYAEGEGVTYPEETHVLTAGVS
jgi:ubiquinone/menaquinone biosynthesis C-methylase UbiE